jgi:molybdopterin/thiamine biosynthesis adenylyltransferase/rhodanese-related sulfurtransferase
MAPTFHELFHATLEDVDEVSADEVGRRLGQVKLIDVREADEHAQGWLPGARFVPRSHLEMQIEAVAEREEALVLYCARGVRSVLAAKALQQLGYTNVASLAGGFHAWSSLGLPVQRPHVGEGAEADTGTADERTGVPRVQAIRALSSQQRERYRRHLVIPEVGEAGQRRLLESKVLLLGVGGLGSPAALYLAAAGVGTLGLVDMDVVDLSNLQRQVLHRQAAIGRAKTASAKEAIAALNPDVQVETYPERLTAENVLQILQGYDLVLDGGDNFPTRYLLNDACVIQKKPNIHGSVARFEGQVTTLLPGQGPCYRCLYPEPPPPELAPSCAEAGVLGVVPGVVGLLQATEAVKLLLGQGELLVGRLLAFDALAAEFTTLRVRRDPTCPVCADGATVKLGSMPVASSCGTGPV